MMKTIYVFLFCIMLTGAVTGQEALSPKLSPAAIVTARYKDTYLKITYSQPHKRGREIFGTVVPFGKVWRTGANEATEITITRDIFLNAVLLKAGTYSIFTIPDRIKWTIIINSEVGLWGDYNYNPKLDVMRFDVPVETLTETYEPFTIHVEQNNDRAEITMMWEKTKVTIPVRFLEEQPK